MKAAEGAGELLPREGSAGARASSVASSALLSFFRAYQIFLSPFLGGACKFYPSCSNYAYQAVARHGARRGFVLALKRIGRCRPFTKGGVDLVPERDERGGFERKQISPAASCASPSSHACAEKEPKQ